MDKQVQILQDARKEAEQIINKAREEAKVIEGSLNEKFISFQDYIQRLSEKGFKINPLSSKWSPDYTNKDICEDEDRLKENLKKQRKMTEFSSVFTIDWEYPYGYSEESSDKTHAEKAVMSCRIKMASIGINYMNTMLSNAKQNYLKWGLDKSLEYLMELKSNIESQMDMFYIRPKLSDKFMALKIEEVQLRYKIDCSKQLLKDQMRHEKELAREEAKVQKEYERELKKARRDEEEARKALEKAQIEAAKEIENEACFDMMKEKIARLEGALQEAQERGRRIMSMAQQTRRGWVYVISNIGSFGEGIYKIGLTRRLDPMERVYELGDASVPFPFDVHAFIFSEDAPALETSLHQAFETRKVNVINSRKEYFKVPLDEIKQKVAELGYKVEWEDYAYAPQYRDSGSKR